MTKLLTLCLIHRPPRVLLGLKKRGFGSGKWNGFGGKVQPGETIEAAAAREMFEESGITINKLSKRGILNFTFQGQSDVLQVHIFSVDDFIGEPTESEEMKPQWFETSSLPFKDMWADDAYWMPLFFAGKTFKGAFLFSPENVLLEQQYLEEIPI